MFHTVIYMYVLCKSMLLVPVRISTQDYLIMQSASHTIQRWRSNHLLLKMISMTFFWTAADCLYLLSMCFRSSRFWGVQRTCSVIPGDLNCPYKPVHCIINVITLLHEWYKNTYYNTSVYMRAGLSNCLELSLVPRLFPPPVFDRLQYFAYCKWS